MNGVYTVTQHSPKIHHLNIIRHSVLLSAEYAALQRAMSNHWPHELLVPLMQASRAKEELYSKSLCSGLGDPIL